MTQATRFAVSRFYDPILAVLSRHTASPGQLISLNEDLLREICTKGGIDSNNLAGHGSEYDGWFWSGSRKRAGPEDKQETNGIARKIQIAYRQLWNRNEPLARPGARGWWGLTDLGLTAGRKLEPCAVPRPAYLTPEGKLRTIQVRKPGTTQARPVNVTSQFLAKRLGEPGSKLLQTMRNALGKRLKVSASAGLLDDHINNCFVKLVARDALAGRIAAGEPVKNHHIASWAVRSAYGDIRNDGTEPICRELYGARTERERKIAKAEALVPVSSDTRLVRSKSEDDTVEWTDIADTDSQLSAGALEDAIQFEQVWGQIESLIHSKRSQLGEQHLSVLALKASGMSVKEIADDQGMSVFRATSLVAEARKAVQRTLRQEA